MKIVSSREFRENQKLYFDLADQNGQVVVQRGKDKAYLLIPISERDRLAINPALLERIREAEIAINEGNVTTIKDAGNIWESIL